MLSDSILLSIISNPYTLTIFQTYKGIAFVLITSILLFFVINREVFKQRQYEKELMVAKEKAEESDRLKTSFINNMSHEIRTPMNCLLGFSELIVDKDVTEDERVQYISIIKNNGNQLLRIIDDILNISKIEVGIIAVKKVRFSIKELLKETTVFINDLINRKGKHLDVVVVNNSDEELDIIEGDKERLIQVLQNLVTNAIKFTDVGSIEVSCFINTDNYLEFHVKDTGIGIKEDRLSKIFEPFTQEEESLSRVYGGTGLGLSISKALVEKLDGEIGVKSSKGKGSDFFFTVPYMT